MATDTLAYKMGDHEAWRTEYNGHEILIVNKGRTRLVIDGEEVAVQTGKLPVATKLNLVGVIEQTGEMVIVTINGSVKNAYKGLRTEVHVYIGRELDNDYGFVNPEKVFTKVDTVPQLPARKRRKIKIQIRRRKKHN